jgi:hypothetical protein
MVTTSAQRVSRHTSEDVTQDIRDETLVRLEYYAHHPDQIDRRLRELDREWDVERALETGSASLSLFGLILGILGRRRWFLLPLVVQGFFLQHALQGWCPPLPLFRRLGFRTAQEIESERCALRGLRGDFASLPEGPQRAKRAMEAAQGG